MFEIDNTTIIAIDFQQKLINAVKNDDVAKNAIKLLKAASILKVDTILTEQYPKGLGSVIDEISSIQDFETVEKLTFSAYKTDEFELEFNKLNNRNVLVMGIETHICVTQTVYDLLKEGYKVYVIKDCCASRSKDNHNTALELMKQKGAFVVTLEMVLFEFLKSSKHPMFKEIQSLII